MTHSAAMPTLEFALLVAIGAGLLPYVLGPVLVRFTHRQPLRWEWVPFDPARHALPAELEDRFKRNIAVLVAQGFGLVADFVTTSMPKTLLRTALLRSPDGDAPAAVSAARGTDPRARIAHCYVSFATEFTDGREFTVSNNPFLPVYGQTASKVEERLAEVRDPERLYRIHRALMRRYAGDAAPVRRDPGEDPVRILGETVARQNRRQVESGMFALDEASGLVRPTWRGAWLVTWKMLPPWHQLAERAAARREKALLRELAMEGPDRHPISAPKTSDPLRWNFALLVTAALLYGAISVWPRAGAEPVVLPAGFTVPADFAEAVQAFERLAGAPAQPLWGVGPGGDSLATDGFAFAVSEARAEALLDQLHARFLKQGFYLFRHVQNFRLAGRPDELGLLPTGDRDRVLVLMGTNAWNYDFGPDSIVAWLRALERDQPFVLTGIGFDFIEGRFTGTVLDADALARRFYAFCPDIVTQGTGSVRALARELRRSRELYCWWD